MKIAVIGGKGKMGSLFAGELGKAGHGITVTGKGDSNIDAVKDADVVIISVPIKETVKVIEEVGPYVKKEALLTDFTSVKIKPVRAMKKYAKCEVIGGHPLFGPNGFKGQNFILCPVRGKKHFDWYRGFLESLGLNVIEMSPDEHDQHMAVIQCLTHFSNISFGYAIKNLGYNVENCEKISSPVYLLRMYTVARILSQDEKLYAGMQMENPYAKKAAMAYVKAVKEMGKAAKAGDAQEFERIFLQAKEHFSAIAGKSNELTGRIIEFIASKK